jgi:hypothetical protein
MARWKIRVHLETGPCGFSHFLRFGNSRLNSATMIRLSLSIAILATAFATTLLNAQDQMSEPNTLSEAEKSAGWKLLFNGKDTSQLKGFKADAVSDKWKIEDGAIVFTEKGAGDILTKEQFDAFEFTVDYKISEGGNSGLMFHVLETEKTPWMTGPEIQIQDNVHGHDPQKAGWLYQLYKAEADATKPVGEWNTLRVLITPEKSSVWMNGVHYYDFVKGSGEWNDLVAASKFSAFPNFGKPTKGHICLQDHGNVVSFRNIKVREVK